MSDIYRIGIHLAVSGNANAFFSTLGSHLFGIHRHFGRVHDDIAATERGLGRLNRMKLAIGGGIAIVGGVEILKAAGHLEGAGEKLVHAKTVLGAGLPEATRAAGVLDATAAAWAEAGKNMNTTVTENVAAIHDLYNVVQDMDHAKHLLPAFNTLQVTLSSVKDGGKVGEAASAKSLASAARAFELYGQTDEHALAEAAKGFTKAAVATRGRVNGENLLTTVQGLGDARYGFDKAMKEQGIPALTAIVGPRVGNMLNMMRSNLYGGVVSSETQGKSQIKYGIHKEEDAIYSDSGKFKGFKVGSMWKGDLFSSNPIEWANAYRTQLKSMGIDIEDTKTMQNVIGEIARGNKTVRVAMDELLLPGTNKQINKEVSNIGAVSDDAAGILKDNDPKLLRDALHKQWENLQTAIGEPLVKPAMEFLKDLTGVVRDLSQAAAANPGAAKMIAEGIVALGASLTVGGVAAIVAAIGPVGWIAAGITALGVAVLKVDPQFFTKLIKNYAQVFDDLKALDFKALVKDIGKLFNEGMLGLPAMVIPAITDVFAKIGAAIKSAAEGLLSGGILGGGRPTGEMPSGLPGQPSSYGGTGIDRSLIHNTSLGGANDNGVGASATAGAVGGSTGALPSLPGGHSARGRIAGGLEMDGRTYAFGSGGSRGSNSIPFGTYPITPGTIGPWGRRNGAIGINNNAIYDKSLGRMRQGIEIHAAHSASMVTQGCIAIAGSQFREFRRHVLAMVRKHGTVFLNVGRDGKATITPGNVRSIAEGAMPPRSRAPVPHAPPMPVVRQPEPQRQPQMQQVNVHIDGRVAARAIVPHMVADSRHPRSTGGMDGHGQWRPPGTLATDAA